MPLWSDEHLKLLDKTFSLLAPLSNKTIFVTAVRRTHFATSVLRRLALVGPPPPGAAVGSPFPDTKWA